MVSEHNIIQCGWCKAKNTAEKWNDITLKECNSREKRRAYTPVYKESTFTRGANTFYKCPSCGSWSRGSQLAIVDTDDKKLLRLGREPLVKEVIDTDG